MSTRQFEPAHDPGQADPNDIQKLDLPLFLSRWDATAGAPRKARLQWRRDVRVHLERHGVL